jgi:hypothetical protein
MCSLAAFDAVLENEVHDLGPESAGQLVWPAGKPCRLASGCPTVPVREHAPPADAAPPPWKAATASRQSGVSWLAWQVPAVVHALNIVGPGKNATRSQKYAATLADRLQVAHVLEGSVRKSGDRIRITAQLIEAKGGFHLWSESYDRQLDDIFVVQDEIALAVVDALKLQLLNRSSDSRATQSGVYALYLQALYEFNKATRAGLTSAIEKLDSALAIDPQYSPALSLQASAYLFLAPANARSRRVSRMPGARSSKRFASIRPMPTHGASSRTSRLPTTQACCTCGLLVFH